jgi:hypothetical protein
MLLCVTVLLCDRDCVIVCYCMWLVLLCATVCGCVLVYMTVLMHVNVCYSITGWLWLSLCYCMWVVLLCVTLRGCVTACDCVMLCCCVILCESVLLQAIELLCVTVCDCYCTWLCVTTRVCVTVCLRSNSQTRQQVLTQLATQLCHCRAEHRNQPTSITYRVGSELCVALDLTKLCSFCDVL